MSSSASSPSRTEVVIAGGGVAALEAALALRELAGDRVTTTLLAPGTTFVYRPARVTRKIETGASCPRDPLYATNRLPDVSKTGLST
jgi:NADPH-dependent 2,4-dienoyl-CoA reductase/sulfur reductase-like enzyme